MTDNNLPQYHMSSTYPPTLSDARLAQMLDDFHERVVRMGGGLHLLSLNKNQIDLYHEKLLADGWVVLCSFQKHYGPHGYRGDRGHLGHIILYGYQTGPTIKGYGGDFDVK